MNAAQFEQLTGHVPEQDDLERVNCERAGVIGHTQCGICDYCGFPRFIPKFEGEGLVCDHNERLKRAGGLRG